MAEAVSFSPREMEVLALAWQCMESEPKINMAKLAVLTGYTPGSASVTLGKIKRKMKLHAEGASPTPSSTPKKATAAGVTPKRKAPKAANDGTPSKKKKGKRVDDMDDDDEEFITPKIKTEEGQDLLRGAEEFYTKKVRNGAAGYEHGEVYGDAI